LNVSPVSETYNVPPDKFTQASAHRFRRNAHVRADIGSTHWQKFRRQRGFPVIPRGFEHPQKRAMPLDGAMPGKQKRVRPGFPQLLTQSAERRWQTTGS
jgi:hypothetical protein